MVSRLWLLAVALVLGVGQPAGARTDGLLNGGSDPGWPTAAVEGLQPPIIHTALAGAGGLLVVGRVPGRGEPPVPDHTSSVSQTLLWNARMLLGVDVGIQDIEIEIDGWRHRAQTSRNGHFRVRLSSGEGAPSLPPNGVHRMMVRRTSGDSGSIDQALRISSIQAVGPSGVFVGADVDDYVLDAGGEGLGSPKGEARILYRILTRNAATTSVIEGVDRLHQALLSNAGLGLGPLIFVSGSPSEFVELNRKIMAREGMPPGHFLYRDISRYPSLDPGQKQSMYDDVMGVLGSQWKGIIGGDDTMQDREVHAHVASKHPGRILSLLRLCVGNVKEHLATHGEIAFQSFDEIAYRLLKQRPRLATVPELALSQGRTGYGTHASHFVVPLSYACGRTLRWSSGMFRQKKGPR